jgi:hypothetical protein
MIDDLLRGSTCPGVHLHIADSGPWRSQSGRRYQQRRIAAFAQDLGRRAYLQIVESRREGDQVRQQVIAMLGHFEDLQLERLPRSDARFAAKAMMVSAAADNAAIKIAVHRIGPALLFERLREETGCRAVIADLAGRRGHKFSLERAVFPTAPRIAGARTMRSPASRRSICINSIGRWLGQARNCRSRSRTAATPFSPRCLKLPPPSIDRSFRGAFLFRRSVNFSTSPVAAARGQLCYPLCSFPDRCWDYYLLCCQNQKSEANNVIAVPLHELQFSGVDLLETY